MRPFDHVLLCNLEFMLWYKNEGESFSEHDEPEWWALDPYKNKVCISEHNVTRLPPQCTYFEKCVTEPRFFGECHRNNKWLEFEIKNTQMVEDVNNDLVSGEFTENGIVWKWNIKDLTLFKNKEQWLLRVMTPGGYWL